MPARSPSGILNVDKPLEWTSHDVVALVRSLAGQRQVGHAGTLDPLATGVLLVAVGAATRLSDYLMHGRKCYHARVRLGVRTGTDDREGEPVEIRSTNGITRDAVLATLAAFRGLIKQTPPAYAAIKKDGVPLYKLARQGVAPEMEARQVRIDGLALTGMAGDDLDIIVWCGAGAYIRALARDIGDRLGCGAHLAALRRLSSGAFGVDTTISVQDLRRLAVEGRLHEQMWPADAAVPAWPVVVLDEAAATAVLHGNAVPARFTGDPVHLAARTETGACAVRAGSGLRPPPTAQMVGVRLYGRDGRLLALAHYDEGRSVWQPDKVLLPVAAPASHITAAGQRV